MPSFHSFQEGPLQESKDERRASLDEKNIGKDPARFLMGTIILVVRQDQDSTHLVI